MKIEFNRKEKRISKRKNHWLGVQYKPGGAAHIIPHLLGKDTPKNIQSFFMEHYPVITNAISLL
jgi:hypothetical protein